MKTEYILPINEEIWQKTTDWIPNKKQLELFQQLYLEIIAANQQLNLTRITQAEEFWEKHIWDSLAPILPLNISAQKVIDIGTGGGFPGMPIAIVFPDLQMTLLDSTQKKINFLTELINKLNIKNAKTLIGRAEVIGQDKIHRENYDLALIRAVAEISVCLEYALPLLKKDGIAILYRGNLTEEERKTISNPTAKLGGIIDKIETLTTPISGGIRNLIYVKKIEKTPAKFPRSIGKPSKNPLGVASS